MKVKLFVKLILFTGVIVISCLIYFSPNTNVQIDDGPKTYNSQKIRDTVSVGESLENTDRVDEVSSVDPQQVYGENDIDFYELHDEDDIFFQYLSESEHPDDRLLFLMTRDLPIQEKLSGLRHLLAADPDNNMILFAVSTLCLGDKSAFECGLTELERLISIEPNNGALTDMYATHLYNKGAQDEALRMLERGAETTVSDDYSWRMMDLTVDAILRFEPGFNKETLDRAAGIEHAIVRPGYGTIIDICAENKTKSDWRAACSQRGQAMYDGSLTILSKSLGAEILVLTSDDPEAVRAKFDEENEALHMELDLILMPLQERMDNSDFDINTAQWDELLRIYAKSGEIAAMRYVAGLAEEN